MAKQKTAQVEVPEEVSAELEMLQGFRDLVAERYGYDLGLRLKRQDMNEETEKERKVVQEKRKHIKESIPQWIKDANIDAFTTENDKLDKLKKALRKKQKPFREKMKPLRKARKYIDNVAVPDALKELGTPIQPRFSLSEWVEKGLAQQKAKK